MPTTWTLRATQRHPRVACAEGSPRSRRSRGDWVSAFSSAKYLHCQCSLQRGRALTLFSEHSILYASALAQLRTSWSVLSMTAAILPWEPMRLLPHVMQVTHPQPAYKGISSPKDCPVFARDYDCRGEYINATYQPLGEQVHCFTVLHSITVHCCSCPFAIPGQGQM